MKKIGGIALGCAAASLMLTGCSMPSKIGPFNVPGAKVKYETHMYDEDFQHTEELYTEYKNGKLTYIAYVRRYDKKLDKTYCDGKDYAEQDGDYSKKTCKVQSNGTVISEIIKMDKYDEFAEKYDQYAESEEDKVYSRLKTEKEAKKIFKKYEEEFKKQVEHSDENNYLVIANKKVTW